MSTEPKDVTVHTGQTAEFECKVGGDPKPTIHWEREGSKIPFGRAQILDNKSLRIVDVMAQDEGLYVCNAKNDVGSERAKASLTVHCKSFVISRPCYYYRATRSLLLLTRRKIDRAVVIVQPYTVVRAFRAKFTLPGRCGVR